MQLITSVASNMTSQVARILECFPTVCAFPRATSTIWAHILNMTFQVTLVCEYLSTLVTGETLVRHTRRFYNK